MKQRTLLLKLLAAVGFFMLVFPISSFACGIIGGGVKDELIFFGVNFVVYMLSFILSAILYDKTHIKVFLTKAAGIAVAAAACFVSLLLPITYLPFKVIMAMFIVLSGTLGTILSSFDYDNLFNSKIFMAQIITYSVVFIPIWMFSHWFTIHYSYSLSVVFLLAAVIIRWIIINQTAIDNATTSRHYSIKSLPKKIYKFNTLLVILLFCCVLILSAITVPVGSFIDNKISSFTSMIENYDNGQDVVLFDDFKEDKNESKKDQISMDQIVGETDTTDYTGIINIIFTTAFSALIFALIFFGTVRFSKSKRFAKKQSVTNDDYTDTVGQAYVDGNNQGDDMIYNKRKFKAAYKKYLRMENSPEKYHFGYRLAVSGLGLCGVKVSKSDTPNEILQNVSLDKFTQYDKATGSFNMFEYGKRKYLSESEAALTESLKQILAVMRKNKL